MAEQAIPSDWPLPEPGREVVLHTRVVTGTGGGPDKTILLSASHLADSRYWLAAAYMHPPGDPGFETVRRRAGDCGCPIIGIPDRGALDRTVLRTLLALCRRYNVAIWHGHDYKSNMLGLAARPFWKMKLVTTVHGWVRHTRRTPLYYAFDRMSIPYYHHVICVSEDLAERVGRLGVPADRLSLIPNAIDERYFDRRAPAARSPWRAKQGVPAGRLVIGAVGRLSPEKAFNNLIRATGTLVKEGLDLELWIAGEGDGEADLRKMIEALGLAERVKLLGFVADTRSLYEAMDVFVLSSIREGLPNVVLEAMSMRVAVVATKVAGVANLITDGRSGLLVEAGRIGQLADAIRRVLADNGVRAGLVETARAVIEERYSFSRRMAKVAAIYDRLLGSDQDQPAGRAEGTQPV